PVTIAQGRGYVTTENQDKSRLAVGEIAVDAIFSPVSNVGYKVEDTRVGQVTDYDKLTMHVETDGIVTPPEAFAQAVEILLDQFGALKVDETTEAEITPTDEAATAGAE
ncbi:MAG: DNA-directed RNA polymerase subunit alpha, partial [Patescibacteria group bacterium]